jgi:hypothetical protein
VEGCNAVGRTAVKRHAAGAIIPLEATTPNEACSATGSVTVTGALTSVGAANGTAIGACNWVGTGGGK